MSTNSCSVITDWKRLWQLVSGIHYETPEKTVLDELLNVSKELQDGLLQFRSWIASDINLEKLLKEKKQEKLLPFTLRLQDLLNLESNQCWEILCYYLTNEYRGSASSLTALISTEANMSKLLDDIWGYYSLERMIVLKIVKNLLIFYDVPNHPYQREYKQIVDKLTMKKLRDSYLKQLEHLINESPPSKLMAGEFFDFQSKLVVWSERNSREIIEVIQILLLLCEHIPMGLEEVKKIFECFKQHSFGKQQRYFDHTNNLHAEMMTRLSYAEVILFVKCIDFKDPDASGTLANDIINALEKDIIRMCHNAEHGPIIFAWMLFKIRCTSAIDNEEQFLRCRQLGKRAVDLNCFHFLNGLVSNPIFKDDSLVSTVARKTVYNLLTYLCDYFDGDGSCARHPFIYELLCELLSTPSIAKEFCREEEGGVRSLYSTLLEIFPIDFVHLSMLANALTKAGMGSYIKAQMEDLPIFTDIYDENKYSLRATNNDEYVLTKDVQPYSHVDYIIPAGTTAEVMERPEGYCVHFRTTLNYFDVLHHEINCLLAETMQLHGDVHDSARVRRVDAGLKFLHSTLQQIKSVSAITTEMVHPTEMCIDLLNKFKMLQYPPIGLLATCLDNCTALLPLVDVEIFTRVTNLNILPVITNDALVDCRKYAHGVCFDSRLVGSFLIGVEKKLERYDFLFSYLSFLRAYTKMQRNRYFQIEIPGLIFLLREVFPHIYSWRFATYTDKNRIYAEVMGFICDVLDAVTIVADNNTKENAEKRLLRDICVYSLLNLENGLMLLKFVALGNAYLQHTMEMETNWMIQQPHGLVFLVRLAMRILMQLLRLKCIVFEATELSPLEALIYTQPKQRDTLRIIPVVTSYMCNIFDRWLPILSCRLLKRIALEFNMSLLACLDMEPDQIRLTFLQKLPDELESDSIKIAILELVEACIEKQPGVTEAFFKVNYAQEKRLFGSNNTAKDKQIADSIVTFIEDYLDAVAKEPHVVERALPGKVMNLFHSLWKQNMQILVEELIAKKTFWPQLCNPLFSELRPNVRTYTQLLNILSIEIFCTSHKENTELKKVVLKFFEQPYFDKWLDYMFDMPKVPSCIPPGNDIIGDDMPEWLCRLQAFKAFLLILLKKQPQFIQVPSRQFKKLAERCLDMLVDRAEYVEDLRPFIILTEMYLLIILNLKHSYTETSAEDRTMLQQLIKLLSHVACCYEDLHVRAKDACLSITIRCANFLTDELLNDSSIALNFLHSVVCIICSELQNLENCVKAEVLVQGKKSIESSSCQSSSSPSSNSLILSLNLLKTVATIFHNDGPGNWDLPFITNKVFQRLLSCAGSILQLYSKQKLSVEILDVLIVFAKGNSSAEFLHCDVGDYLWLKLLPPRELLQTDYTLRKVRVDEWTVEKWWPIYARGIELVTILFQKYNNHILQSVLQFVGIHEEYLVDSLLLGKQSLEPLAMNLVKSAVSLIAALVPFEKQWRLENSQSLFSLMRSVQMLMGHAISMFHQPKNLKCLLAGRRSQFDILSNSDGAGLVDEMITAFNDLSEIIILCVKCLQGFSPKLLDLICAPEFLVCHWEPIFEIHFGAPKLCENAIALTFGTVLSIVGVYTKVLNLQSYGFHEVPLNVLPIASSADNDADASTFTNDSQVINSTSAGSTTKQRHFSKSVSVTSVSSVNCPPNELLSNLDGELCLMALEHILTLAASQSMLALKNDQLPPREKQLIRREISTELLTYHEFVRKKVLIDYREHKGMWHRRKHGQLFMKRPYSTSATSITTIPGSNSIATSNTSTSSSSSSSSSNTSPNAAADKNRRHSNDLRVNVVRRQHLQHQQQLQQNATTPASQNFEMSHVISPICSGSGSSSAGVGAGGGGGILRKHKNTSSKAIASTPNLARPPIRRSGEEIPATSTSRTKRVYFSDVDYEYTEERDDECDCEMIADADDDDDDEIQYFPPEEPTYSPLSYVQLVEEDYLHFMSNLFHVICQSD